jgi:hypothetical protein
VPADLTVHVNRDGLHSLSVPASVEVHGHFDVALINHGESLHVHLHLDDGLSEVGAIDASNHYVEADSTRVVRVHVDESAIGPDPIHGKLKLASAYGAETRWVDVDLVEPDDEDESVTVDDSLSTPQPVEAEPEPGLISRPEVPVIGLGLLALVVALVAILAFSNTLVFVGSLVVLGGVLVALYFLAGTDQPV